jgi:diguanylate cyclase (GGDEF)-like protein
MARKYKTEKSSGRVILLVDDSQEYLEATRLVLEHEGHKVLPANCGKEALKILSNTTVDLVLLDYYMPGMTGEEVVAEIRKVDPTIQIILQTGYASEYPPRDLLRKLNIQGYYDKSEGTEKLLLWVDVGLKAAYTVSLLNKSRQGLNYILDITPEMHKIQPLEDLLQGILWQFSGLLGFGNSFLAVLPDGKQPKLQNSTHESFLAMVKEDMALRIHAGIGRFTGKIVLEDILESDEISMINETIIEGKVKYFEKSTLIPLRIGDYKLGVIYLDENIVQEADLEMLNIFANQAAVAIQNAQLYEMATRDQLTGTNVRGYAIQLLTKELRTAFHSKTPISIMLFDLDNLKGINDNAGHSAGDRALALLGKALKKATRSNDVVGRYGGDEFTIVLPQTDQQGAIHVAERILEMIHMEKVYGPGQVHPIKGSFGITTLNPIDNICADFPHPIPHVYFQAMVQIILKKTDELMYLAKNNGHDRFQYESPVNWTNYSEAMSLYDSNRDYFNSENQTIEK